MGRYLKRDKKDLDLYGIELVEAVAAEAALSYDDVVCADLDLLDWQSIERRWEAVRFDTIIYGDVLEHLKDPGSALVKLNQFAAPACRIIVSLPNVRHWSVTGRLVFKGRWDYEDAGILDRTHLRFFTRETGREFLEGRGLRIEHITPLIAGRSKKLDDLTMGMFNEHLARQFVYTCSLI